MAKVGRLIKEREVDQGLWEALNFAMRDDEDLLSALEGLTREDAVESERAAQVDRLAAEAEERARERVASAEHELGMARHEQRLAHEQRMETKRLHTAAKKREETEARIVKDLRLHTSRNRRGVVEWASFKGFEKDMLPELQLMSKGGLRRLMEARERRHPELSAAEAEAI